MRWGTHWESSTCLQKRRLLSSSLILIHCCLSSPYKPGYPFPVLFVKVLSPPFPDAQLQTSPEQSDRSQNSQDLAVINHSMLIAPSCSDDIREAGAEPGGRGGRESACCAFSVSFKPWRRSQRAPMLTWNWILTRYEMAKVYSQLHLPRPKESLL